LLSLSADAYNGAMAERPKLPRNVWIAGWVSLFNDASSEMIYPLLPLFITGVLKASRSSLGLIEGVAEATASLLKVYSGTLSDRFRTRKLPMAVGYGLSLAARPLIAAAGSWEAVFVARFTDRFGKGIRTAPRDAVLADSTPVDIRGRAFGVHRALDTVGAAIGPAAAMFLLGTMSYDIRTVFWISIIPGLVALALIALIRDEVPAHAEGQAPPSLRQAFAQGGAFRDFLWVTVLFTLGNSSDTFLLLKAQSLGLTVTKVTGVYLLFNIFYAAVSGPIGAFADVWGRRRVTLLSFFYYALVYAGFAWADAPWTVVVLFVLYGPFQAVEEGVKKAYVSELLPPDRMGSGMGVYNAVRGIALLPASLLTGVLWDRFGPAVAFGASAGIAALAGVVWVIVLAVRRRSAGP
jgi:MFS family permease